MSIQDTQTIAVLGAGSWGTALAMLLARNDNAVNLWSHNAEHATAMQQSRENNRYLPGLRFPEKLSVSADLEVTFKDVTNILIVVPSHAFRDTLKTIKPFLTENHTLAWATKGLETDSNKLLHQVAREELAELAEFGNKVSLAVISGPTFAGEVAQGLPGAVTVASEDQKLALEWANLLHNDHFRAYTGDDVIGVELGGACKNVIAIAAGIADGMGFGANARAALIARALAEITRLGVSLGANAETFTGLTGLGDLVLTCTDDQSRNRRTGIALGAGKRLELVIKEIGQVVEGVATAKEVVALAKKQNIDMPITEQVYNVLYNNYSPEAAVNALFNRTIKKE
ncbi:MAG: NAD(P)-dependent glycerol-3-phosphate dehydrogenase [Gammaproteobacteria bacterium]|nr:NAD(P)-dependent glycerol-3-phosphate dehydrogenase [Gammaproteobacteria bacterium]